VISYFKGGYLMHIVSDKETLLEAFSIVQKAIPLKTPLNILKGFFVQADEQELIVAANNLEISIKATLQNVKILKSGSVVIQDKIIDILRQLPEKDVEIKMDTENLRIEIFSGKANFILYGIDPEEYPRVSEKEQWSYWSSLTFTASAFKKILKGVTFAVSQDEGKPSFKGILLELLEDENKLYALATDTYRLALFEKEYIIEHKIKPFKLLVPGKLLIEILKVIENSEEEIQCYFKENEFVILYRNYVFSTRLLEDKYPDLKNIFPQTYSTAILAKTEMLEKMIQRATLFSPGSNQMISLQVDEGSLKVKAVSNLGRMDEELFLEEKEGENLNEIFLNARYLLDSLRILEDNLVRIEFNGPLGPCVFVQNKVEENYHYRYLVLPIKTEKNSP